MLSLLTLLLFQGNFFSLRMNTASSFPRPLKPEEERRLLAEEGVSFLPDGRVDMDTCGI